MCFVHATSIQLFFRQFAESLWPTTCKKFEPLWYYFLPPIAGIEVLAVTRKRAAFVIKNNKTLSNLLGVGIYSINDVAAYTGIRASDIRRWIFGYKSNGSMHQGLWRSELAGQDEKALSFNDLLEMRFVHAFRKHGVSLQAIRRASEYAREQFNQTYPFTCRRFQPDGQSIFATILEETGDETLLDLVKRQYAFKQVVSSALYEGIEYADEGAALRWYPVGRKKGIVLDPARNFGKPSLVNTGINTEVLFRAYKAEDMDSKRVAALFEVPVQAVKAAIEFEIGKAA